MPKRTSSLAVRAQPSASHQMQRSVTIRLTRRTISRKPGGRNGGLDATAMGSHNSIRASESSKNRPVPASERNIVRFPAAQKSGGQKSASGLDKAPSPGTGGEEPLSTNALIGIGLFLAALVLAGVWLMNTLRDIGKMQDCAMQGRRNCAPIEAPPRDR